MAYMGCADTYVRNMTLSYAGRSNETLVVLSSALTLALAAFLLGLSLFSRVAILSSVHHPHFRLYLTGAISLFLPVMSYLFSEAKKETDCVGEGLELALRAREILTWMLLMEVLQRKVEAVNIVAEGTQRYFGIVKSGANVVWLGYLVFTNVKGAGRTAVFRFLWIICATKWVQSLVFAEVKSRSLAYDKNPRLVSSYMDQMLPETGPEDEEKLRKCDYLVMGEEKLVSEAGGPWGYLLRDLGKAPSVVTVGQVWRVADVEVEEGDHRPLLKSNPSLKRLCLSMALFKLLRRRVERLSSAMAKEETDHCRDLILQGLLQEDSDSTLDGGSKVLEVLNNEVDFLSEYYHSVHPVVLASPYFFAVNYLVVPAVACLLCLATVVISSSGHLKVGFRSIRDAIIYGALKQPMCLLLKAATSPEAFFPAIDVLISYLLYVAFFLEIAIELLVFLLSNWFMVSLLRSHVAKNRWRHRSVFPWAILFISWARRSLRRPSIITVKQFSVLTFSMIPFSVLTGRSPPAAPLPSEAKRSIMKRFRLAAYGEDNLGTVPLSKGSRALEMPGRQQFSWFCNSDSVTEVILTWHIATSLLEMKHPHHRRRMGSPAIVATRLSNYCAHLVASCPELLPGHQEGTSRVFSKMKKDLRKGLGIRVYYLSSRRARYNKMMLLTPGKLRADSRDDSLTVLQRGIVLGKALMEAIKQQGNEQPVWELLADVWVELIVYISPSSGEDQSKGHQEALMHGCELVTLLWALATHTGITCPLRTAVPVEVVEDGICPA